jgi:hypothetical protein
MFCPRTFCPHGRFVPTDVLSAGPFVRRTFCPTDLLSPRTFCPTDVFSLRTFCPHGRFVPTDVLSTDVLSPDVLSGHRSNVLDAGLPVTIVPCNFFSLILGKFSCLNTLLLIREDAFAACISYNYFYFAYYPLKGPASPHLRLSCRLPTQHNSHLGRSHRV